MSSQNPIYIYDLFRTIAANTATQLGQNIHFIFGPATEIRDTLAQMSADQTVAQGKYPMIALITDMNESRGLNYQDYATINANIIIATLTQQSLKAQERLDTSFEQTLYPIYFELLRQITRSRYFILNYDRLIPHTKIDRFNWGRQQLFNDANLGTDFIDAIEIQNLNVRVHHIGCEGLRTYPVCADGIAQNSDQSYVLSVPSGAVRTIPNITITYPDGSTRSYPAAIDYVVEDTGEEVNITNSDGSIDVNVTAPGSYLIPDSVINNTYGDIVNLPAGQPFSCDAALPVTVENSNQSYQQLVNSGDTLVLPDINFTDSNGVTTPVPAVTDIVATPCPVCPTLDQQIASDGGFYLKYGALLPESFYHTMDIDPVQSNDRMWFTRFANPNIYKNKFSDFSAISTIATGATIQSNVRYHNGIVYCGSNTGLIKVIDATTDAILDTVNIGVSTNIAWICVDTVNNRLMFITTTGAKIGYLWVYQIGAAPNYLTYVTDILIDATAFFLACDNVHQEIIICDDVPNGLISRYSYALTPISSATGVFPSALSQRSGIFYCPTFDEIIYPQYNGTAYRLDRATLTANFDSLPIADNHNDNNRTYAMCRIPWEARKYLSHRSRSGVPAQTAVTTR